MKREKNEIVNRKNCTGCGACKQICPKDCISFIEDKLGFQYPSIDQEKCVQCGLCRKVCPALNTQQDLQEDTTYFAAYHKDADCNEGSSSGGIFKLLAEFVLSQAGVVFGVMCDDEMQIHHGWIDKVQDIGRLQGSKYVQSDIRESFREAEIFLKKDKIVLFSGTPCQIAGLKRFLRKDYSNLICIDLVCHGVPYAKLWEKYIQWHKEKYKKTPVWANFRDKSSGWRDFSMKIKYDDGSVYCRKQDEDPFLRLFLQDIVLRESCYACSFKGIERQSDITLGDCWGIERIVPAWKEIEGVSLLMVHSLKGKEILQKIEMTSIQLKKEDVLPYNRNIMYSIKKDSRRRRFRIALAVSSIELLADQYCKPTLLDKVKYKLRVYCNQS